MTLKELVPVMNMWQLDLAADKESDLHIPGLLHMTPFDERDRLVEMYGDREVTSITNVCKLGVTIWIK